MRAPTTSSPFAPNSFAAMLFVALLACAPGTEPDPDAGQEPGDAGPAGDAGQLPSCTFSVNGTSGEDPGDCAASAAADVLDPTDTTIIGFVGQPGDPTYVGFSVTVDGPLAATSYTMGGAVEAFCTLTRGDDTAAWRILKEGGTNDGDFTLTVTDTGTKSGTGASAVWAGVHGTFEASFSPVSETGASGPSAFTLSF